MAVRILITRKFKQKHIEEAYRLLLELRSLVTLRQGYISGETLISADDPHEVLVISTWTNLKKWEDWVQTEKRKEYHRKLEPLLEAPERTKVYFTGEKQPHWVDMA
jgi:quinol monooxygenase YgiN